MRTNCAKRNNDQQVDLLRLRFRSGAFPHVRSRRRWKNSFKVAMIFLAIAVKREWFMWSEEKKAPKGIVHKGIFPKTEFPR
eukprot:2574154-Amphidinium_carterae.1